jgi:hypothetical protein
VVLGSVDRPGLKPPFSTADNLNQRNPGANNPTPVRLHLVDTRMLLTQSTSLIDRNSLPITKDQERASQSTRYSPRVTLTERVYLGQTPVDPPQIHGAISVLENASCAHLPK